MDERDAIALLQQLVEIPSLSGEEEAAVAFLAAAVG
jgi:acetylornithine deacetylase/succinyl-diaminopimelate desuccinylase-like protein